MEKWFKLAEKWYHKMGLGWNPRENWKKFVNTIKLMYNISSDKIKWSELDFDKTRRMLIGFPDGKGNYILFEDCFEIKPYVVKENKNEIK